MNKKLYDLKMQILREKGISDWLKKELSEQVFQIEQELAINYTRCCMELRDEYLQPELDKYKNIKVEKTKDNDTYKRKYNSRRNKGW